MEPVAVVGLGCVFPDAASPSEFWTNLMAGRRSISTVTALDFGADPALYFDPEKGAPDSFYCLQGGYVHDVPLGPFDYGRSADELATVDPTGRWALEAARQALVDSSNVTDGARARCGLVLGNLSFPTRTSVRAFAPLYERALAAVISGADPADDRRVGDLGPAMLGGTPAMFVASALGLGGPRFCLDAACASSLYAIRLACDYLASGRADLMLAGGVSAAHPLYIHAGFSTFQAYPEDGAPSNPLDRSSGGMLTGEGSGFLALKRLADAERDGDVIKAVVRAVGLSNDGRGRHLLAPSSAGQLRALERACADGGLDRTVDYLECHATGTPVGDLTELDTIERFYGDRPPLLGAFKANVGHLLTAAGVAGTIKVVMAMEEGVIPPTVGVTDPLVSSGGTVGPDQVVTVARTWPAHDGPRRGAVNAFGFGGMNAHLVLEQHRAGAGKGHRGRRPALRAAVTGVAAHVGPEAVLPPHRWRGLERIPGLLQSHGHAAEPPPGRYLDAFQVDGLRYKAPPGSSDIPIPQQLLVLDVADHALADAGISEGAHVGVVVAMSTELSLHQFLARLEGRWRVPKLLERHGLRLAPTEVLELTSAAMTALHEEPGMNQHVSFIGSIMASRIAALWDLSGPAFTVSDDAGGLAAALEVAQELLDGSSVEAVLVAAVELAGGPEAVLVRGPDGPVPTDAAAALVLRRGEDVAGRAARPVNLDNVRWAAELADAVLASGCPAPLPPTAATATTVRLGGAVLDGVLAPVVARVATSTTTQLDVRSQAVALATGWREVSRVHAAFLSGRQRSLEQLGALLAAPAPPSPQAGVVWDQEDLEEFAGGSIAKVFGPSFAPIDAYRRRVRLPMPPYLLVSRVTELDAEPGQLKPSRIVTEYDVPTGAWYTVDGAIPWAVAMEAGQCDLLLIAYLGIDFRNRGDRVYRLLDCSLAFFDRLPREGDTLRYDIRINSFTESGDTLLFFFSYDCFVGDRKIIEMREACAGFFTDEELQQGKGVLEEAAPAANGHDRRRPFRPPLSTDRTSLGRQDLDRLSDGDVAGVFGPRYQQGSANRALRLTPAAMRMLDRVVMLDTTGGRWGLGLIVGEKDLRPDDWFFPCHFKDDEVLAGSLMMEGCVQLLATAMLAAGLQADLHNVRFQPVQGLHQRVRCRGQVTPDDRMLTYRVEITEAGTGSTPFARANAEILLGDRVVVAFEDLALEMREDGRPSALFDERAISEFATGSFPACFGPDFAIYETRRAPRTPNGDLQLVSRVVDVQATRLDFSPGSTLVSQYDVPTHPWFWRACPSVDVPYSILMEIALQPCGFLSAYLGSTLLFPEADFYFRNLDGTGVVLREVDLRGRTVENHATLTNSTSLDGVIIQQFGFELRVDGEPFYRGTAAFGHFSASALSNQVGLDQGRRVPLWLPYGADGGERLPQTGDERLHLLDELDVVGDGGRHSRGYVRARAVVDPARWYFDAHFHQDPVMPGSLGVEAIHHAVRAFAQHAGLGQRFRSPRFTQPLDRLAAWKYRGQIVRSDREMALEAHVTDIVDDGDATTVFADASLWKDGLRIYEVQGAAITVCEGP